MTLRERCHALAELKKKLDLEGAERARVKYGEQYVALSKQIEALMEEQDELLAPLPNSQPEYEALAREVMDIMDAEKVYTCGNVSAKFKEKNEVNTSKVLSVIGGDMDLFVQMANITQTKLKDFAKSSGLKKELMDCVEVVSRDIVSLEIAQPSAA